MRKEARRKRAQQKKEKRNREDSSDEDEPQQKSQKKQKSSNPNNNNSNKTNILDIPIPTWNDIQPFKREIWNGPAGEAEPGEELKLKRKDLGVLVRGNLEKCPPPIENLNDSNLPSLFKEYCESKSIYQPTPVQLQCWPAILAGGNVLGIAPTGSGKTLTYALPAISHIQAQTKPKQKPVSNKAFPKILILVPTRELAIQVVSVFKTFKSLAHVQSGILYGGLDKQQQLDAIRSIGPALSVLVATPGRLLDVLSDKDNYSLDLKQVTYQVIDEADRMLSLGFAEQLDAIGKQLRPDRQIVLFSATFPGKLRDLCNAWVPNSIVIRCQTMDFLDHRPAEKESKPAQESAKQDEPMLKEEEGENSDNQKEEIAEELDNETGNKSENDEVGKTSLTVSPTIKQLIHLCAAHKRPRLLIKYIERIRLQEKMNNQRQADPMIIFCNTIKTLNFVQSFLNKQKLSTVPLHGQLPQEKREENLSRLRSGKTNIILATDVAARGIHIKRLKYVVNYDFPGNIEQYCHRIGRCGRQGEAGEAYSLMTRKFAVMAKDLIRLLKSCQQEPEPNLLKLAADFKAGKVTEADEELEEEDDEQNEQQNNNEDNRDDESNDDSEEDGDNEEENN